MKINPFMIAALAGGAYLLYRQQEAAKAAVAQDVAEILPPNMQVIPNVGAVLVPPVSLAPPQTYTAAVQTPYGAVIPSNFSTTTASNVNAPLSARMQEIIYRHQYIFNSIAYALNLWASQPATKDAGADDRIATLRAKDAALQSEYMSYSGGKPIPDGTVMGNAAQRAAYVAFLRSKNWCDPLVGIPCQ